MAAARPLCPLRSQTPLLTNRQEGPGRLLFPCLPLSSGILVCAKRLSHVSLFATPGIQHASLPCPSLSPGVCSNSCPLDCDVCQPNGRNNKLSKGEKKNGL